MNVLCVPLGPGYITAGDTTGAEMIKIVQTPGLILILNPDLTYRQVYMDGRKLEDAPNPSWMGYSVGHWDGDTLVVDSFGFNDRTWLDHDGHPHTEALRITERYRRRDFGNLDLEVTFSDPGAYNKPWTVKVRAQLAADTSMLEWVCNDVPSKLEHWVGKASDVKKTEVKVPAEYSREVRRHLRGAGQALESDARSPRGRDFGLGQYAVRRHGRPGQGAASGVLRNRVLRPLWTGRRVHEEQFRRGIRALCEARIRQLSVRTQEISDERQRELVSRSGCSVTF